MSKSESVQNLLEEGGSFEKPVIRENRNTIKSFSRIVVPLVGASLLSLSFGLEQTVVPIIGKGIGFNEIVIGRVASLFYIGLLAGCFLASRIASLVSREEMFGFAALLAGISMASYISFQNPFFWMVFAAMSGVSVAIMSIVAESWISSNAPKGYLGFSLAIYLLVYDGTYAIGPAVAAIIGADSPSILSISAFMACIAGIGVITIMNSGRGGIASEKRKGGMLIAFMIVPWAFIGAAIGGFTDAVFFSFGAITMMEKGFSVDESVVIIAVGSAISMIAHLPSGIISDRWGRKKSLLWSLGGTILAAGIMSIFYTSSIFILTVAAILFLLFTSPLYGLSGTAAYSGEDESKHASIAAGMMISYALGGIAGPTIAGYSTYFFGGHGMTWVIFGTVTLCAVAIVVPMKKSHLSR